ncbi:uridine kinase [Glaciihabitans tibetensis]|uniref:Uridine kinase n=1 Tax=Glaciihabitans tibetensis TaxID=1266600 RepID=A0A2T0VHE8_9MICO|nr:uridine kinase [Glaciihabitans tibetensis]PRY69647.1 uridine kinase [Glaciihabitans tibetensis]
MARWAPLRTDTLSALAEEILHNYGRGHVIVAVDAPGQADATTFADDLADAIRAKSHAAFRASLIDFSRPRAEREARGADSAEGAYRDAFDYPTLTRALIEPFRRGGSASFVTASFDVARDTPVENEGQTAPDDAILIVDGPFLNRAELAGFWNYSVWLDAAGERTAAEALYAHEVAPRTKATAIVDNSDPEHPRRSFADSC